VKKVTMEEKCGNMERNENIQSNEKVRSMLLYVNESSQFSINTIMIINITKKGIETANWPTKYNCGFA
jgi:hypothetical protein